MRLSECQQLPQHVLIVITVPDAAHLAGRVIQLSQSSVKVGVSSRLRAAVSRPPELPQSIDENRPHPATKRAGLPAMLKPADILRHRQQNFLEKIIGVAVLHVVLP